MQRYRACLYSTTDHALRAEEFIDADNAVEAADRAVRMLYNRRRLHSRGAAWDAWTVAGSPWAGGLPRILGAGTVKAD